jgi:YHS domain-containing protein
MSTITTAFWRRAAAAAALLTLAASTACGGAQARADGPLPASAVCPVTKETFTPTASTPKRVYQGRTYYFCCPGCDKKFDADPAKYAAGAAAGAKKPCGGDCAKDCADCANPGAKAAAKKPCGGDCGKDCADCANPGAKGAGAPAVEIKTASELGLTPPAKATCPVSGKEHAPTADSQVAMVDGKPVWFCCPGCAKKFAANPAKFAPAQ